MSDPTRDRRVLLEDDDGTVTDPVPLPSEGTDQAALKAALQPILEQLEAGDIDAAEALDSILEAVADPGAASSARQTALTESESSARHARRRHATQLLEGLAPAGVTVTSEMVNLTAYHRTASAREAKAEELIAAERARKPRLAKRTAAIDAGEALASLMDG